MVHLEIRCPYCRRTFRERLSPRGALVVAADPDGGAPAAAAAPASAPPSIALPSPVPAPRVRHASPAACRQCGHDAHVGRVCGYGEGIGTTIGLCRCAGKPKKARAKAPPAPAPPPSVGAPSPLDPPLQRTERRILEAVTARWRASGRASSPAQVRVLAGYRPTGSFEKALREMRGERGLLQGPPSMLWPTERAAALVGELPSPSPREILALWQGVGMMGRSMLEHLTFVWPALVSREELARETRYQVSGSFDATLRSLVRYDLVAKGPGAEGDRAQRYKASDLLMDPLSGAGGPHVDSGPASGEASGPGP
jgi:hypothetical protein